MMKPTVKVSLNQRVIILTSYIEHARETIKAANQNIKRWKKYLRKIEVQQAKKTKL